MKYFQFQRLKILIKNFLCNILVLYFFTLFQERRNMHISFINFLNRNFYCIPNYTHIFLNKTKNSRTFFMILTQWISTYRTYWLCACVEISFWMPIFTLVLLSSSAKKSPYNFFFLKKIWTRLFLLLCAKYYHYYIFKQNWCKKKNGTADLRIS